MKNLSEYSLCLKCGKEVNHEIDTTDIRWSWWNCKSCGFEWHILINGKMEYWTNGEFGSWHTVPIGCLAIFKEQEL